MNDVNKIIGSPRKRIFNPNLADLINSYNIDREDDVVIAKDDFSECMLDHEAASSGLSQNTHRWIGYWHVSDMFHGIKMASLQDVYVFLKHLAYLKNSSNPDLMKKHARLMNEFVEDIASGMLVDSRIFYRESARAVVFHGLGANNVIDFHEPEVFKPFPYINNKDLESLSVWGDYGFLNEWLGTKDSVEEIRKTFYDSIGSKFDEIVLYTLHTPELRKLKENESFYMETTVLGLYTDTKLYISSVSFEMEGVSRGVRLKKSE